MVQWKMANYLKGKDLIGDTPIFDFHDYGRLGGGFKYFLFSPLLGEMIQFD